MQKSPDEALAAFCEIKKIEWKKFSEADTRSKIIDRIFIDCLNWDTNEISREDNIKYSGYVDYIFKKGETELFLIEAKKTGVSFEIPSNYKNRIYKIGGVLSKNKPFINAIEQALEYCTKQGIKYGIVTNGYQYIIFEGFKKGTPWDQRKCHVFNGMDDIEEHFNLFFKYLNRESVHEGGLSTLFSGVNQELIFNRPLERKHNKDAPIPRNYLSQYITPFINYIFRDITSKAQKNILRKCYIFDKTFQDTSQDMKQIFYDRVPTWASKDGVNFFIEKEKSAGMFEECIKHVRKHSDKGSIILLLGGIGSGKTTFIHRFYNIILEDEKENVWFYIDFSTAPTTDKELENYIYENIINDFEERYYPVIQSKIEKLNIEFDKTDKSKYVASICGVLPCLGYSLSLVLDNVDRCKVKTQENIFLHSQFLTKKLSILVVLAIREESYFRSKHTGVLDAYHINKFRISFPKFERLILQRINYLIDILNRENKYISNILNKPIDFGDKKKEVIIFFEILRDSLTRNTYYLRRPITNFMTCISEGNMRIALDMFNNFLQSGNTKVEEMMREMRSGGTYTIAPYQFLKSVILGHLTYYQETKSDIMNLFDVNTNLFPSHFLHLRILNYAYINRSNDPGIGERGFIRISELIKKGEDLSIPEEAIRDSLRKLVKFNLIKFETYSKELEMAKFFRITATGEYYINHLVRKFIYLDLIHPDTPICSTSVYDTLRCSIDETNLEKRFDRTSLFIHYLKEMEEGEFDEHPEYQKSNFANRKFTPWILDNLYKEMRSIRKKQKKRYG